MTPITRKSPDSLIPPTEANFVWVPLGPDTPAVAAACDHVGVAVRPYDHDGIRVSVSDPQANDAFLTEASAWPRRH